MEGQKWRMLRLMAVGIFVLVPLVFSSQVARSEYPERPVTVIVAMDAGGTTDVSVRAMAPGASSALGQSIIVENKGGGGGTVALAVIATAKPDGYTLCAAQNVLVVETCLMQNVPFKP